MSKKINSEEYPLIFSRLAELRKNSKMTKSQIADKVPTSETYISKLEKNDGMPSLSMLVNFSNAYDVTLQTILNDYITCDDSSNLMEYKSLEDYKDLSFDELVVLLDLTERMLEILKEYKDNETEAE